MANYKKSAKPGRRPTEQVTLFPRHMLRSKQFYALSPKAKQLLIELASQYTSYNNGDLTAAWTVLKKCGWNSSATLDLAKKELVAAGFISVTRQGKNGAGADRCPTLYALTWRPIDECGGKLDVKPTKVAANPWLWTKGGSDAQ